jgi:1-acyl-sn-glycerol-3-phosphate acyltransferase
MDQRRGTPAVHRARGELGSGVMPSPKQRLALAVQAGLGRAAFAGVGPAAIAWVKHVRGHRIEGLAQARRVYRQALASGRPTVVCANHLTLFDSVFLHHAFGSIGDYLLDFRRFSWNVPAIENFTHDPLWRALTYLGKCIPIDRAGDAEHHKSVLDKVAYLASHGQVCTLFPEGGRSRTGRVEVDQVTYGIGRVLAALERPQVVCAYLRGEQQASYSDAPARGDVLHVRVDVLEPSTALGGLRGARDLARQVIVRLRDMEDRYFAEASGRAPDPGELRPRRSVPPAHSASP